MLYLDYYICKLITTHTEVEPRGDRQLNPIEPSFNAINRHPITYEDPGSPNPRTRNIVLRTTSKF